MKLYHLVAVAQDGVIGKDNKLPWHFSADLKHFKKLTMANTIIMGRKTFESLGKKPLPGRENFVLSRGKGDDERGFYFFTSIEEALKNVRTPKAFIIGGAEVYHQTLNQIDGIYLTRIHASYEGDSFYPEVPAHFKEREKETVQENPKIEFVYLENQNKKMLTT